MFKIPIDWGTIKGEKKTLDAILLECVKLRDRKCQHCGEDGTLKPGKKRRAALQAAHIYPKGKYPHLRWDLENVILLCSLCHIFWWHKDPIAVYVWMIENLSDQFEIIKKRAEVRPHKATNGSRQMWKIYLFQEWKRLRKESISSCPEPV